MKWGGWSKILHGKNKGENQPLLDFASDPLTSGGLDTKFRGYLFSDRTCEWREVEGKSQGVKKDQEGASLIRWKLAMSHNLINANMLTFKRLGILIETYIWLLN